MIELKNNELVFSFPEVHKQARMSIEFQRTLRIPDDESSYSLPPGLGNFPLRHVDDFASTVPAVWNEHGGVLMPMYQSEAMWINFTGGDYPFAVKIAAGKINAVTGELWTNGLHDNPQNYIAVPEQPWLDGFCVEKGLIRQFIAMPLGEGYTAEEQITDKAEVGGLQIIVYPMKRAWAEKYLQNQRRGLSENMQIDCMSVAEPGMGLAPGGKMKQEIYEDEHGLEAWDLENGSRCFVHLANSNMWRNITCEQPPHQPPTAQDYSAAGLPWFDYYSDAHALDGSKTLKKLKSVKQMGMDKGEMPVQESGPVAIDNIIVLGESQTVREFV
jgi:hypothetical protein